MLKKIKKLTEVLLVIFSVVVLFIAILTIWDFINNEMAKEVFMNVVYTFGVIFGISLAVMYITKTKE